MTNFVSPSLLQAVGELDELFAAKVLGAFDDIDAGIGKMMDEFRAGIESLTVDVEVLEAEVKRLCADRGEGPEIELPPHFPQEGPGGVVGIVNLLDEDVLLVDSDFLKRFEIFPGAEAAALEIEKLFCGNGLLMTSKRIFLTTLAKKLGCFVFRKDIDSGLANAGIDVVNSPYPTPHIFSNLYLFGRINDLPYDLERIYVLVGSKKKVAYRLVPKSL
ncbi:MAG: hypothetical protein UT33_C0007G0072 [Candidatus Peregrinibacteria bacterium GW2011_GWC2_39_14]|nr:MAG: hypothetical protein US92_C0002G0073 [Candidatus Peregrinibacteria bacterium GW2011_GWA2_38_36]KKR06884.1 MAG: hypothetical protein UT33_C0007G0072 [Candidatus Peregrinibacteria bacterium GW2011_GWC2_39_14]